MKFKIILGLAMSVAIYFVHGMSGNCDAGIIYPKAQEGGREVVSFLDSLHGFCLVTSDPSGGLMEKKVYRTVDGGRDWDALASPSGKSYYTTGMVFRSREEGWITGTYHGGDAAPLYHTQDGGKSWQLQHFEIPADYVGGYADTYPPVFIGAERKQGYLPVKLVRHEPAPGHYAWVNYESEDGGLSWHLPKSGVQSVPEG